MGDIYVQALANPAKERKDLPQALRAFLRFVERGSSRKLR